MVDPAFARQRRPSSWRTLSAGRSPIHFPIRPPDDALAEEGTFGHRRLLHVQSWGERLYRCDDCHDTFWRCHCCRDRACPNCHGTQARQWLEERQAELLPCAYFHAVVTVPSQFRAVLRATRSCCTAC